MSWMPIQLVPRDVWVLVRCAGLQPGTDEPYVPAVVYVTPDNMVIRAEDEDWDEPSLLGYDWPLAEWMPIPGYGGIQ